MTDLVSFYRNLVPPEFGVENPDAYGVMISAAKARETANEIERLREALRYYAANHYPNVDDGPWGPGSNDFGDVARAALGEGKE